jgi:hypothetical protein
MGRHILLVVNRRAGVADIFMDVWVIVLTR